MHTLDYSAILTNDLYWWLSGLVALFLGLAFGQSIVFAVRFGRFLREFRPTPGFRTMVTAIVLYTLAGTIFAINQHFNHPEHTGTLTTTIASVVHIDSDNMATFDNGTIMFAPGVDVDETHDLACFDLEPLACAINTSTDLDNLAENLSRSFNALDSEHGYMSDLYITKSKG